MKKIYKAEKFSIAFDLDGTLIDTAPDLIQCLHQTFQKYELQSINHINIYLTQEKLRLYSGRGAISLLEKAYQLIKYTPTEHEKTKHLETFLTYYDQNTTQYSSLFPDVLPLLKRLKSQKYRLSICTNKPTRYTHKVLQAFKLNAFFDRVITPEDTPKCKPDALHLKLAVNNATPNKTILIGDTDKDIITAQSYGAMSILMTHGYQDLTKPFPKPDKIFNHFSEMIAMSFPDISK